MDSTKYKTPDAFLTALSSQLRKINEETKIEISRLRKQIAFDRFLARLFFNDDGKWVLKGGYSLELHFNLSRATKDIDLSVRLPSLLEEGKSLRSRAVHERLVEASEYDLGDFFRFLVNIPHLNWMGLRRVVRGI